MEVGGLPQLEVLFQNGQVMQYTNPSQYACHSFDCPNLQRALVVSWTNLPLHQVAAFYETDDCKREVGHFTYSTPSSHAGSGYHNLPGWGKMIRSVMLGRNEDAIYQERSKTKPKPKPTKKSNSCSFHRRSSKHENAFVGANFTGLNTSMDITWVEDASSTGGLSANWSDPLSEAS
ncbi:unnamed protein product [Phytophthora fragariaefolia]|uniref:Unnamed protein product n=1 Tax=Phytophthora fragariaefolia TaxID=1490495 RepID=A0A9W6U2X2_9STRA|nr:unnamed protein product [Phytophthora fragariaefolia]